MAINIEELVPGLKEHGINTAKNITTSGTNTFSGTTVLSGATTLSGTVTQTGGQIIPTEVVTATNVITASESGKTFFLNAAAGFLSTLPAPAAGLNYRFIVQTAPTSNGYTIATTTSANIIKGMVVERAGGAGVASAVGDLVTLVANQSIAADWLEFYSDGTTWFVHGMVDVAAGVTIGST